MEDSGSPHPLAKESTPAKHQQQKCLDAQCGRKRGGHALPELATPVSEVPHHASSRDIILTTPHHGSPIL
eukprot:3234697-Amphidinium_carterae.2